jgi:glutathione peroxidase-family protein
MRRFLFASMLALSSLVTFTHYANAETASSFSLPGVDGKTYSLDQFKGKVVVLEWFNSGCPFVEKYYESGAMQRLQKEYTSKDVVWLTINSSAKGKQGNMSPEEHRAKMTEWNMTPTMVLLDENGTVGRKYSAKTTPHMFIVNKDGSQAYQGAIDDKPSTKKSDIESSKNYVKAALDELLAGKSVSMSSTTPYGCSVKYAS